MDTFQVFLHNVHVSLSVNGYGKGHHFDDQQRPFGIKYSPWMKKTYKDQFCFSVEESEKMKNQKSICIVKARKRHRKVYVPFQNILFKQEQDANGQHCYLEKHILAKTIWSKDKIILQFCKLVKRCNYLYPSFSFKQTRQGVLCQVWLKIAHQFWEKKIEMFKS